MRSVTSDGSYKAVVSCERVIGLIERSNAPQTQKQTRRVLRTSRLRCPSTPTPKRSRTMISSGLRSVILTN